MNETPVDAPAPETGGAATHGSKGRGWLYGTALVLVAGLVYGGFVFEAKPDVLTVLGTVDMALKTAHTLPEFDKTGKRLAYRDGEIARAEALLRGGRSGSRASRSRSRCRPSRATSAGIGPRRRSSTAAR